MSLQETLFDNVNTVNYEPYEDEMIIENTCRPQSSKEDCYEHESTKNQLAVVNHQNEIVEIKSKLNPMAEWSRGSAEKAFEIIQQIQKLLDEKLPEDGTMTIQGNTFDLKSNLEIITSLTGTIPKYLIKNEEYGDKNSYYKIAVECLLCKGNLPLGVGTGTCSSYDNKEAYKWVISTDVPKWRFERRDVYGNYDKNIPDEQKRIYDAPNGVWVLEEDLEQKINDKGHKLYKICLTPAEFREIHHKIARKAHVRALREAVNFALARTSALKNKTGGANSVTGSSADLISDAQAKRLYAISKGKEDFSKAVMAKYGYTSSKEIKKRDYNKICSEVEKGN